MQDAGSIHEILQAKTCLDSIKELREDHKQVMAESENSARRRRPPTKKLNILVDTVDRIIRTNGKEG